MRKLISILFLLTSCSVFAQQLNPAFIIQEEGQNHIIKGDFEAYHSSGDLKNDFTNKFIRGGFIDSTLKQSILNKLKEENRIGAEINYGISYFNNKSQFFGLPQWGWCFGLSNFESYNLSFSKNSFELTFFGNKGFAGDTVELAPMNFNLLRFQKFSFGIFNKSNNSSIKLGIIKGEDFAQLETTSALLYTESTGAEINLALQESLIRSDTTNKGFASMNGIGFCTDLVFYLNIGKNRNVKFKNPFKITLENFGFIHWNSGTLKQEIDTNYNYQGFEVEDLLNGINSPFSNTDLGDTLGFVSTKSSYTQFLPFTFSFSKVVDPNSESKLQAYYGVRLRAKANYKPLIFAGVHYQFVKNYFASLYASFGGYGGFRAGIQLGGKVGKHMQFNVNTGDLVGMISKQGYGRDLGVQLLAYF